MRPIVTATPAFNADGTPLSTTYDDVYHSTRGAIGQAEHVFLKGNDLPGRWAGRRHFTILESGFGLGVNFLSTWHAWRVSRAAGTACERLHYVSIEKHPFGAADLMGVLRRVLAEQPHMIPLAEALTAAWPLATPGLHRLEFDSGRVVLTVAFGAVEAVAPRLALHADAFYFDGFAPAKNPEMWSPGILTALTRLAAPQATFATFTAATPVLDALIAAGFDARKTQGYVGKRHMLSGTLRATRQPDRRPAAPSARHAMIVGAGLAGCGVAERLAARGWRITLVERHAHPAGEASGNPAGTFHPVVSRDDNPLARLTRNAFLHGLRAWRDLERRGHAPQWQASGVLQLPGERRRGAGQPDMAEWPGGFCAFLDADAASERCGVPLKQGGLWFPDGGWIVPASLCAAQLAAAGDAVTRVFSHAVASVDHEDGAWRALDARGAVVAHAPVLILANALDAVRLMPHLAHSLRAVRGQLSYLAPHLFPDLAACVCGNGYLLPAVDGRVIAGATYEPDDLDVALRAAGHADNLARIANILRDASGSADTTAQERERGITGGRAALRAVTPDRLPLIGALHDPDHASQVAARSKRLPHAYCATGFGSRGILWGTLAGEILASQLEGEPAPVEADLLRAIDPARFAARPR